MNRRKFVAAACGVMAVTPMVRAQRPPVRTIGFLSSRAPEESAVHVAAFRRGLAETGHVEGQNVAIETRWARGAYERLPKLASELVGLRVDVLAAVGGPPSALAARAATPTVPIVFLIGADPVHLGLVASFNRPGGNLTGVSFLADELGGKRLALLSELAPGAGAVVMLLNPANPRAEMHRRDLQTAARELGRRLLVLRAGSETEIEPNFAVLARERAGALVVENDPFFDSQRDRLVALAAGFAIPAIYHIREFPAAGGLMSYGASLADAYRAGGVLTGRILRGEKPADLPVAQPTRFELVINAKTAGALGLTIPQSLLLRTDELIR